MKPPTTGRRDTAWGCTVAVVERQDVGAALLELDAFREPPVTRKKVPLLNDDLRTARMCSPPRKSAFRYRPGRASGGSARKYRPGNLLVLSTTSTVSSSIGRTCRLSISGPRRSVSVMSFATGPNTAISSPHFEHGLVLTRPSAL